MTGWRCTECGWETFDVEVMRAEVNWPEPDGTITLKCPACGAEGKFEDAESPTPEPDGEALRFRTTSVDPDFQRRVFEFIEPLARQRQLERLAGALRQLAKRIDAPLRHRPDGWPLCPRCGADELYTLDLVPGDLPLPLRPGQTELTDEDRREWVLAIHGCYACGWMPRTVGPLAEGLQHWEGGDGAPSRLVQTTIFKPRHSPGPSTTMGWWP